MPLARLMKAAPAISLDQCDDRASWEGRKALQKQRFDS
jgi:hypothetical protein